MNTISTDLFPEQYRTLWQKKLQCEEKWIEVTLAIARLLYEKRQEFPSDNRFSVYLAERGLDYFNGHDRAALINMGEHIEMTKRVLEETNSRSYQLIWEHEMRSRFASVSKPTSVGAIAEKEAIQPSEPAESSVTSTETTPETALGSNGEQKRQSSKPRKSNPLSTKLRGDEIWATYGNRNARTALTRLMRSPGARESYALIVAALDQGFLRPNNDGARIFSAHSIFTGSPLRGELAGLDLSYGKARVHVKEIIMPAAIANREAILAAPDKIERIINEYRAKEGAKKLQLVKEQKLEKAKARMPATQQEIIAFGKTYWPKLDDSGLSWDYDQLRTACFFFVCLERMMRSLADNAPRSIALHIRQLIKFPSEYAIYIGKNKDMNMIFDAIRSITLEFEQNPHGECKWPMFPTTEGKW